MLEFTDNACFLRRFKAIGLVVAAGAWAAAASSPASAAGKLNVYNWGDYINPKVLQRFGEEFDVEVTLDTYNANEEMLAKVQAGATGYDIVFPSVHMHDIMHKLGLLHKTNINEYEGFKNIDPDFLRAESDPNGEWCLPYAWGTVGIMYNKEKVGGHIGSWQELFDLARNEGKKFIMLDDMRETIGVGLILNGKSVNTGDMEDLKEAEEAIIALKPYIASFTYDSPPLVASGDVAAAHWFTGALITAAEDPDNLFYVIPEEGATMYQEDICVLASAPNKENAIKFLEFYTRPEIAALNVEQQLNGTANVKARDLLPDHIKNNPAINPPPEVMSKLQIFRDLGKDIRKYDRVWTRIRTAQ